MCVNGWPPDVHIMMKGQPATAVAFLFVMHVFVMHVAIALVAYNALVYLAPIGATRRPSHKAQPVAR